MPGSVRLSAAAVPDRHRGAWLVNLAGGTIAIDGYGRLFQATAGFSGIAAATTGVWLTWRACGLLFSARASAWSALVLWVSSSAIYCRLRHPPTRMRPHCCDQRILERLDSATGETS